MSSIITTGINIVATGVNSSINQVKRFGQALTQTEGQVKNFARRFDQSNKQVMKSSMGLSSALSRNWQKDFDSIIANNGRNQGKALKSLEQQYDRTFRNIGNKYQSMIMGSVAMSMSGVGMANAGKSILGMAKTSLDASRDFELGMQQIQFYGHRTAKEMESIQKQIFQMGYDLPVTTSEIGESVLNAQKLGYDNVKDAMAMAKEASKIQFMSLGKIDGEESLKYISQFRNLVGASVKDTDVLTDKLSKTADVSAASIDSLWKTIQSSRTAYDSLGADVDTFLTLTGTMADRLSPRNAGMALNSFAGGVQMAEKAGRENRGTRGKYYNQLTDAMGGNLDSYKGDVLKYVEDVAVQSRKIWGEGTERKGNLQSIFGKSAVDLFYAIDAAMKKTGKSMHGIREEIKDSGGHAEKYMETIMNTSYGTEMKLQAVKEQFQILFGNAIRPMFNKLLGGIEKVLAGINKFMLAHPKLTKVLGYGFGLAGLLLTATGAAMLFVGGILAIYASLANLVVQLARNTRVLTLLSNGFSSAGAMIKGQFMGPLTMLGKHLLKTSAITFFLWLAWKNDFLRMRTAFNAWKNDIHTGLNKSSTMFDLYSKNSVSKLDQMFQQNEKQGGFSNWIANKLTKARMLWDGIKSMWKDGTLSIEQYQMMKDAGLLPYLEAVYNWKTRISDFWKGFQAGMKDGIKLLKDLLSPLKPVWEWISKKVLELFQHFGYFKKVNKGIGSEWEQWGTKIGYLVGSAIAVRLALWGWVKAIKTALLPFRVMIKLASKLASILRSLRKIRLAKSLARGLGRSILPKSVRNAGGYANQKVKQRTMRGASSPIPNARRTIDPATGRPNGGVTYQQPTTWRERRRLAREQRRANGSTREGVGGANGTRRSRGIRGRWTDMWQGEAYLPEERYDKNGRKYNQIRTRDGRVMRSTGDGLVRGQEVRTGGVRGAIGNARRRVGNNRLVSRTRANSTLANMINFSDAGMDYQDSVGRKGHRMRSVKAGAKGFINRSRRQGFSAGGNSLAGQMSRGGRGIKMPKLNFAGMFKGVGKAAAKVGPTAGKMLIKGLGTVVKRGLPLLFKVGLRAIPYLGWALMAWDVISAVFSNWGAIKGAASTAWTWIKTRGVALLGAAWEWIKSKATAVWNGIKSIATAVWTAIKTGVMSAIGSAWEWIRNKASAVWASIKGYAASAWSAIKQGIMSAIGSAWEWVKSTASATWSAVKSSASGAFSGMFDGVKKAWQTAKDFVANNPITQTIKQVVNKVKGKGKGHRTGLWKVPGENYPAMLHSGEMVLTQKEAQILRSMVGSDSNSISQFLLERNKQVAGASMSIANTQSKPRTLKVPVPVKKDTSTTQPQGGAGGNTEVTIQAGAIQVKVANASPAEMKRGAREMLNEIKRLIELDNMKNYRPARPR